MHDVLAVGELNADIILTLDDPPHMGKETMAKEGTLVLGSSTALCAIGMKRLGLDVGFYGKVGDDPLGHFVCDFLAAEGIGTSLITFDASATGFTVSLSYPEDRAMVTHGGSIVELTRDDVTDDILRRGRHLHIASLFLQTGMLPGWVDLVQRAKSLGMTVSSDCGWDPTETWALPLPEFLEGVDLFLPNEPELLAWTRTDSIEDGLKAIGDTKATVVVKAGADGAYAYAAGKTWHQPAFPTIVKDTTGAGDAFNAGYIWAFLQGKSTAAALRYGAACGALAVAHVGGVGGFEGLDDAEKVMKERFNPGTADEGQSP